MKYNKLSLCLIAALCSMTAFTSCSDDIMSSKTDEKTVEMTFKAVIESPKSALGSRTYLGEENLEGTKIYWDEGDEIAVGKDKSCFTSTSGDSRETEFTGGALTFTPGEDLYAFYPNAYYHPDPDDEEFEPLPYGYIEIPKEQDWNWGYAEHAQMIAKLKDGVFKFKPTCALIKIRLDKTMNKCSKIVVTSESGKAYLSGQFRASIDDNGNVGLTGRTANSKVMTYHSVTMSYMYGYLPTYCDIYIAVAPVYVNKLVMEFHTEDNGVITKTSGTSKTFQCGEIWDGGDISYGTLPATHKCPDGNHPHLIDLGLPSGTLWACMNVGATAPTGYGDYFAWGETSPYYQKGHALDNPCTAWKAGKTDGYWWTSYKWNNGTRYSVNKYCVDPNYGTLDNKTILDPQDDAAYVNWGSSWCMPTDAQQDELYDNCFIEWTDNYNNTGVKGLILYKAKNNNEKGKTIKNYSPQTPYSLNDTHIFLPATNVRDMTSFFERFDDEYYWTHYWSSEVRPYDGGDSSFLDPGASAFGFYKGALLRGYSSRFQGLAIRPVKKVN